MALLLPLVLGASLLVSIASPDPTPSPPRLHTSVYARANQITMNGAGSNSFAFGHADYDVTTNGWNAGASYQLANDKLLEAYLSYKRAGLSVRAGDQFFHSPWADTHLVWGLKPTAFQGIDAKYEVHGWTIEAADMTRFESRSASSFTRTTLLTGVTMPSNGFTYGRLSWDSQGVPLSLNGYVYRMSDLELMTWFTARATLNPRGWSPYVRTQAGSMKNIGRSYLGPLRSSVQGALFGADPIRNLNVEAGFDVNHGAWMSPYTDGYTSDPLYTSPLLDGMVDRHAAGSSSILDATYASNDNRLKLLAFDAWYDGAREVDGVLFYRWNRIFLRSGLGQEFQRSATSRHLFVQLEYSSEGTF